MNRRLSRYVYDNILGKEQAGFREGYSTTDHVFVLTHIIELYQSIHKRVYCAFIDYSKAFDTVDRTLLCQNLLSLNIDGKFFNVIKNMYDMAKSCVRQNNLMSEYFLCNIGVRQGDNLSPLLFALFINDFSKYIDGKYRGLCINNCYPTLLDNDIAMLNMFVLLYADDTIVLAENACELQKALDAVHDYCGMYNLTVNTKKTKIIVFSRGKVKRFPTFKYGDNTIEVVSDYIYLGITMNFNNKFNKAIKKQLDQGRKALFSMLVKTKKLNMPIDIECTLFEKLVFPILLYGCEIWGFHCVKMLETFYRKFLKKILHLRPSTPTCMVYGEVGKLPLQVTIDKHMINYWIRLLNKDITSYASIIYTITLKLFISGEYKTQWLSRVKGILDNCGLSYIWLNQNFIDNSQCKSIIHKRIEDMAHQKWYIDLSNSSMCITYKLFKTQLHFEKYLLNPNCKDRINLTKLRCSNSKIPIYSTIYMYDTQKCTLCNMDALGDEYHYVLICPFFKQIREQYLKSYYYRRPSHLKLEQLLCSSNNSVLLKLAKFSTIILKEF